MPEQRGEGARGRIERLLAEGRITHEALEGAQELWRARLQGGIKMPNGETATVTLDDLYHLLVDPRIWRKPRRIGGKSYCGFS